MTLDKLRPSLYGVRDKPFQGKPGLVALCPVCQDPATSNGSGHLIVWEGADGEAHYKCSIKGCDPAAIRDSLQAGKSEESRAWRQKSRPPEDVWDYVDESGHYIFSKAKWSAPKSFRQGVRDSDGEYRWNLKNVRSERPLYRLPELLRGIESGVTIHLCEGEKAVDRLFSEGMVATCQSDGAGKGKLRAHHIQVLCRAAEIVIWADRDEPGLNYSLDCASRLIDGGVRCRILQSKTTGDHHDAYDHLEAGFTVEEAIPLQTLEAASANAESIARGAKWKGFLSVAEVLADSQEEPNWLWEGLLPVGGVCLFCAKPKVGKSTLLRHLALSVARGEAFLDRNVKKGKVLYLAIEETPQIVGAEIRRVGWTEEDQITLRFGSAPHGDHRKIVAELQGIIQENEYSLLIIDTIGRLARVRQGNDYAEVTQALEPVIDLARVTGCAVIMTHHLGKNDRDTGDGALGSTAYFAAVDVCIDMKKVDGVRVLGSVGRAGMQFEGQVLDFHPDSHRVTLGGMFSDIRALSIEERIIDKIMASGPQSREELKKAVGGNASRFADAFKFVVESGRVSTVSGKGAKGSPRVYGILDSGSEASLELELENPRQDCSSRSCP